MVVLREYLYVDVPLVRGLLAQLDEGIKESETATDIHQRRTLAGAKGFVEHDQSWSDDRAISKSFADAAFPMLEDALESSGLLNDVSGELALSESWTPSGIRELMPPGRIIRITAPGWLMDSRYLATITTSFSTLHHGLAAMGHVPATPAQQAVPPRGKGAQGKGYKPMPKEDEMPESMIPLGALKFADGAEGDFSGENLRGITQVIRAMYSPGLHLNLMPSAPNAGGITARLQEGRQYLDSSPEVVFSRYGVGEQLWTLVGTVGHHPSPPADMTESDTWLEGGVIGRSSFARYVTQLAANMAALGFADLPQSPGFSVVPWAVYRTLAASSVLLEEKV